MAIRDLRIGMTGWQPETSSSNHTTTGSESQQDAEGKMKLNATGSSRTQQDAARRTRTDRGPDPLMSSPPSLGEHPETAHGDHKYTEVLLPSGHAPRTHTLTQDANNLGYHIMYVSTNTQVYYEQGNRHKTSKMRKNTKTKRINEQKI